jgi:hypothetical protein
MLAPPSSSIVLMDLNNSNNKRQWKVLCWNVRGINSQNKWTTLRSKISKTKCDIICLQETKREHFDQVYISKFYWAQFDCFEYIPSHGTSGGTIIIWKSSRFLGQVSFQNEYAMSIEFVSSLSGAAWTLTNVYAPYNFPFTYLGLPLSTSNPTIHDCLPMAPRIEKRLISTSLWLTQGGKLQLVNSVMSSLPTFYMCTIKLPISIIKQIDKYRRHCL